jgi:nucleoside-diphosphate-sugar epimerase
MRIVVTGGNGRVGRYLLAELVTRGHEVTSLDFASVQDAVAGVRNMRGDVTSIEDVLGTLTYAKAEAIVHMAAWSDPGIVADTKAYSDNTRATFNVLNVAEGLSLKRVIVASSAQVYGFSDHAPVYASVDEEHPLRPTNSYALSKVAGEQAAAYFAGRGLNVVTLRIMGARAPEDLAAEVARARDDLASGGFLLWTRADARDIAVGCRQALEAPSVPSGIYNLTGACNVVGLETDELLRRYCPETEIRGLGGGDRSALSIRRAEAAFGYAPAWRPV